MSTGSNTREAGPLLAPDEVAAILPPAEREALAVTHDHGNDHLVSAVIASLGRDSQVRLDVHGITDRAGITGYGARVIEACSHFERIAPNAD